MSESKKQNRCAICGKPADEVFKPFCSKRCADVDLHRWLAGVYAVPVTEDEEEDERRTEDGDTPHWRFRRLGPQNGRKF